MESLMRTLEAEVPDTAATLRLSGMELADCIQEVGAFRCVGGALLPVRALVGLRMRSASFVRAVCSADVTEGMRASARALVSAEQGLKQGVSAVGKTVTGHVLPRAKGALFLPLPAGAASVSASRVLSGASAYPVHVGTCLLLAPPARTC